MKRVVVVFAIALPAALLTLGGCTAAEDPWEKVEGGNLKVLVSFPPLYAFTRGVADKDAKVLSLLALTGPHEYHPTLSDSHVADGADLFLVNGLTLDDFVTDIANRSRNKNLKVIKVADQALAATEPPRLHLTGAHARHSHSGEWDPHAWLGIEQAILMVQAIRDALKEADPGHAANYDRRAAAYVAKLKELETYGKDKLKDLKNRKLIANHESLRYFCRSFDLELVDMVMPQTGVDPDLKQLADLVEVCKKKDVHLIAVEPQYPSGHAEKIKTSLKASNHTAILVDIDPLETGKREELDADWYLKGMRKNLDALAATKQ
jgi:ABC-type Zn uptake system ZnuABC Zn-binding protein ZnuA